MASNYNTRGRVAEIAIENGNDRLIRKRETFEDIIALEEEFIK
jgi:diaminopimelate decarboxylase